jgi:hypothetical protein
MNEEDEESKEDAPDTVAYYRSLPQSEVDKIKYMYLPSAAFDRCDVLHSELCGKPNTDGTLYPYTLYPIPYIPLYHHNTIPLYHYILIPLYPYNPITL